MNQLPDIEIIIPTYNRLSYLRLALKSALAQNYRNFSVTVVDSASNDGTLEFLKEVVSDKLRIVRFEDNLGISGNWTRAYNVAEARLVSIFHDDDIMLPNFVSQQVQMFASHPDVVLSHTAGEVISGKGEPMFHRKLDWPSVTDGKDFIMRVLTEDALVPIPPSVTVNRKLLPLNFEFEADFPAMVDLVAWIQAARYGRIGYINEPLVQYRVHEFQTTNSILNRYPEKMRQRELFFDLMRSELVESCGYTTAQGTRAAWRYFSRAVSSDLLNMSTSGTNAFSKAKVVFFFGARHPKLWLAPRFVGAAMFALVVPVSAANAAKGLRIRFRKKFS